MNTDAYTTKIDRKETYFRVFLKAWDPDSPEQLDATVEQLQRVLKHLQDKGYMGNVYFMAVSEEVLIQLQHSCMDCFFAKSSVGDALAKYVTCIDRKELDQLIADPTQYIVAQHVPKQGMSCIVNPIIDPPLAP